MSSYQRFRGDFEELTDAGKWPISWLDAEIAEGRATAFGNEQACIVAALRRYPGGTIEVHGLCAAGDLNGIVSLIAEAEEWGRVHGATVATISSRRGWARALAEHGYAEAQVMIEKDLR